MADRVLALGCLLVFLLASQRVESQTEFVCYASTDCYGVAVSSLPQKGECCAGRGLSFQPDGLSDCQNCFTEESFTGSGSEFYLAFFNNLDIVSFLTRASVSVRVSNLEERPQTVRISFDTKNNETEIGPGKSMGYDLPVSLRLENIGETGKGVVIRSMDGAGLSVTAYGDELTSSDTYRVLPCVYLPSVYEYYAMSVAVQDITIVDDGEEIVLEPLGNSVFVVVASEDNTQVTITPTQSVSIISPDDDETLPGTSKTVTLNKRETLFVSSVEDLTGSHVLSDKPVAFFSGHECGNMPATISFCDQMIEQIPPTSTWGKEFYTVPLMMRERDGYKAISSRDGNALRRTCTDVSSNNVEVPSLDLPSAGEAIEFDIPMDRFCRFESNFPVLLVQFSLGGGSDSNIFADPFMAIIPPVEQYRNSYMLDYFDSASPRIVNYLNIILVNSAGVDRSDVRLGGESIDRDIWTGMRCSEGSVETCAYAVQMSKLGTGTVSLTHPDPNAQLLGITYALGYRTGQGSFSGMTQKPIALDTVTLGRSEYSAEEGSRVVGITLNRTGDMLDSITVPFRVQAIPSAENAAIPDEDFMEMEMDILFPSQTESVVVEVELAEDDIFPEDDKVFEVYIGATPGAFVSPNAHVNVTILNDDPPLPVMNISFSVMFHSVMEGGGFLELTLIKTEGAVGPVTVSLFTAAESATDFEDFEPLEVNITFEAPVTERRVQIVILNDNVLESVEQFSVTIVAVEGVFPVEVIDAVAVVEITDNDRVVIGFQLGTDSIDESVGGSGLLRGTLEILSGVLSRDAVIQFQSLAEDNQDSQATEGRDYDRIVQSLTFVATSAMQEVAIPLVVNNDVTPEERESFSLRVTVTGETTGIEIIPNTVQVSIIDNDSVMVMLEPLSLSVFESAERVEMSVSISAGDLTGRLLLGVATISNTAMAVKDFEALTNFMITYDTQRGGNETSFTIGINNNDEYAGSDRTFNVSLYLLESDFENIVIAPNYAEITIIDDESPPPQDIECQIDDIRFLVATPQDCCVSRSGSGYHNLSSDQDYTILCIVIGFDQTVYELSERESSYELQVDVIRGSLVQNITLTVIPFPGTADASDYRVSPWVLLSNNKPGSVTLNLAPEVELSDEDSPREDFHLDLIEESGILPRNVFFRGADVVIIDRIDK